MELYDLEKDVGERENVASLYPEKTAELHRLMKKWRTETHAPVPTESNPKYGSGAKPNLKKKK